MYRVSNRNRNKSGLLDLAGEQSFLASRTSYSTILEICSDFLKTRLDIFRLLYLEKVLINFNNQKFEMFAEKPIIKCLVCQFCAQEKSKK